ncbi:MAG: hypothetical protein WCG52_02335 [bacterium]
MRIVSGICPVEHLGAGRVIRAVESQLPMNPTVHIDYVSNKSGVSSLLRKKKWWKIPGGIILHGLRRVRLYQKLSQYAAMDDLVLMHFQEIGFDWCLRLLRARKSQAPVWFFLFDSAFFCRKSYNHIDGENSECLRCLGGDFQQADHLGCQAFPRRSSKATKLLKVMMSAAREGKVAFFAQNDAQKCLAERHFGATAKVVTSGTWTDDFDGLTTAVADISPPDSQPEYDVVFHANPSSAKGFGWALEVAKNAPRLRFLFPSEKPQNVDAPNNCTFLPLRWDTGLSGQVRSAPVTLLPSLWSAPVEGALLKSILVARKVAVADVKSAYSGQLPEGLVLRLSLAPNQAASALDRYIRSEAQTPMPPSIKSEWLEHFKHNRSFVNVMQDTVTQGKMR